MHGLSLHCTSLWSSNLTLLAQIYFFRLRRLHCICLSFAFTIASVLELLVLYSQIGCKSFL